MTTPNWQHNSGKPQKRTLKPQGSTTSKETSWTVNKVSTQPSQGAVSLL